MSVPKRQVGEVGVDVILIWWNLNEEKSLPHVDQSGACTRYDEDRGRKGGPSSDRVLAVSI